MVLQDFEKKIFKFIKDYKIFNKYDKILLGVSGGKDSISLLNCMSKLSQIYKLEIAVAHLNHGMREEAPRDEDFVRQTCKKLNVPFFVEKKEVFKYASEKKVGVEEAGRDLRYDFFSRTLKELNYDKIATAHHMDDLAETIIYRIIRGTGIYGLAGMVPLEGVLAKPMLCVSLEEIENYVTINNIPYVEDKYNYSLEYSRNKIRYEISPKMKEINPSFQKSFFRLASTVWEYRDEVEKKFNERVHKTDENSYKIKLENDFFDSEVLRLTFLKFQKYPPNMEETKKVLLMKNKGYRNLKGLKIVKEKDFLIVTKDNNAA